MTYASPIKGTAVPLSSWLGPVQILSRFEANGVANLHRIKKKVLYPFHASSGRFLDRRSRVILLALRSRIGDKLLDDLSALCRYYYSSRACRSDGATAEEHAVASSE